MSTSLKFSQRQRTHWEGCWQDHFWCARQKIKELKALVAYKGTHIRQLQNALYALKGGSSSK